MNHALGRMRLALVRSNAGPARRIYTGAYHLVAALAARILRARFPAHFDAIYLRRGLAMGFTVPGVSDVDLLFVLRPRVDAVRHEEIKVAYRRLARAFPVLDPEAEVFHWNDLLNLHAENPTFRFRLEEGRTTWRPMYGCDRRADIPHCGASSLSVAHTFDLKARLPYFSSYFFFGDERDPLLPTRREYLLFKLIVDSERTTRVRESRAPLFDRDQLALDLVASTSAPPIVRSFLRHTMRYRLRRSFFGRGQSTESELALLVLRRTLSVLAEAYATPEVRDAPEVQAEREHFYGEQAFLPTGRPVVAFEGASTVTFEEWAAAVRANAARGAETVLRTDGLLVNLSLTDPALGNCSAVLPPTTAARAAFS